MRATSGRKQQQGPVAPRIAGETEVPTMRGTERNRRLTHVGVGELMTATATSTPAAIYDGTGTGWKRRRRG
ncbi:hypothetical protein E2562_026918 [Oryza meyeriana var. granulata]|uniref:Uncharacterized protein n=1 Tax=Oryza meyeriana var. granulata TaxID=110450 RepID=A0A6G1CTG3_9ORYZ|nr:hypothetical protein E2562_026918 [Oryza meyeriana var. granulata]